MATTIAAVDPRTGTRGLLVEVHPGVSVPEQVIRSFKKRLFVRNIRVGLLVTRAQTMVLRDTLSSMDLSDNKYESHELNTKELLAAAQVRAATDQSEGAFTRQVVQMLEAVGSSWYSFLHPSAVSAMVPDVVGNLAEANIEVWDGLLDHDDAAE